MRGTKAVSHAKEAGLEAVEDLSFRNSFPTILAFFSSSNTYD